MSDSLIQALAAAAGGVVAMTATYPLIFLSTRAAVETNKTSKSTYRAVLDIIEREGIFGLYNGLDSSLLGIAVTNGIYYFFYENSRTALLARRPGKKALTALESLLGSFVAGTATTIISNPIWVVQTSQAVHTMKVSDENNPSTKVPMRRPGFIETLRTILNDDGISALWRGLAPALILVINPILQYTLFEQLKNALIARRTQRLRANGVKQMSTVLTDIDFFLLGAFTKLVATSATYPYIVIKSRLQAGHGHSIKNKSTMHNMQVVIKNEGIAGLYKGLGNKLVQSVLTAAILFASQKRIYEMTSKAVKPAVAAAKAAVA